MPRYNTSAFDPLALIANVALRRSEGGELIDDVILLIDTGADITLLPRSAAARLGMTAKPSTRYELIGFDGNRSVADALDLEMVLLNKSFRGHYLLTDDSHGPRRGQQSQTCVRCAATGMVGAERCPVAVLLILSFPGPSHLLHRTRSSQFSGTFPCGPGTG